MLPPYPRSGEGKRGTSEESSQTVGKSLDGTPDSEETGLGRKRERKVS